MKIQSSFSTNYPQLARTYETLGDAVTIVDNSGRLLFVNSAFEDLYGYDIDELLGKPFSLNVPTDSLVVTHEMVPSVLDERWEGNVTRVRKNGEQILAQLVSMPLMDQQGKTIGIVSVVRDLTDVKLWEKLIRREAQELKVLGEIGSNISSSLDTNKMYEHFCEKVVELIPFDRITINLIDLDRSVLQKEYLSGINVPERELGTIVPLNGTIAEEVARTRSGLIVQGKDLGQLNARFPSAVPGFNSGLRSFLSTPLIWGAQVIGVFNLRSLTSNAYTQQDLALAGRIGAQIAGAIANSQLHSALQRETIERTVLAKISHIITFSLNIDEVFEQFAEETQKLIPFDRIVIVKVDEKLSNVTIQHLRSEIKELRNVGYTISKEYSDLAREVIRSRKSMVTQLSSREELLDGPSILYPVNEAGIRSFLMVPLISEGHSTALLTFESAKEEAYTNHDLELAEKIAEVVAGAIANANLHEQLVENESYMRSLVDNLIDAIIVIDEVGVIQSYNNASERIFGYSANEAIGRKINMLMPQPYAREHDSYVADYFEGARSKVIGVGRELEGQHKDGTVFPIDLAISELHMSEGRMFLGIIRDISERKQLEAQFLQAQKMEAVGTLLGGVAHDFNNMLSAIMSYTHLAMANLPPVSRSFDYLEESQKAALLAANLTRQLLSFSRSDINIPRAVDVNEIISNIHKMLRRLIKENIELTLMLGQKVRSIMIDPGRFEQILINLVINASDALPHGGDIAIETANITLDDSAVKQYSGMKAGDYMVMRVRDNGIGMTREVTSRIFEPFFTTKEVGKGTGLGLATCYGIVERSEGCLMVESELGKGSTFSVYLPGLEEGAMSRPVEDECESLLVGGEVILLVEDVEILRRATAKVLSGHGYKVLEARNGVEALEISGNEHSIDLLLTDLVMPLMTGEHLANDMKKLYPKIKIIFTSGYYVEQAQGDLNVEGSAFLQKPVESMDLLNKMRDLLDAA